jgi:hypothetical protein
MGCTVVLRTQNFLITSFKRHFKFTHSVKRIIVTAEPVTSVDITSADVLAQLQKH